MSEATNLTNIGEFGLIKHLTEHVNLKHKSSVYGIGDDAAVIDHTEGQVLVTTDLMAEGIHFDLVYVPLKHLGYKAVISNFSDIYAMNGTPTQIVVSIAVSSRFDVEQLDQIYDGIKLACEYYNVDLIGGDTTSSLTGLTISITCIGYANAEQIVYRHGAKENDLVCVSGNLGAAYMGLQLLVREKEIFEDNPNAQPQLEGYDYILERQLKPEARHDIIEALQKICVQPTSMIDISDGLSSELNHICTQSGTGCNIYAEKIPIDSETARLAEEMNMEPLTAALNGGEDYELLFTVPVADHDKIQQLEKVSVIGHITAADNGMQLVTDKGNSINIKVEGWDNLKKD
jgi:thiamine-monophosphate kinase